jgi:hypothetical protein
MDVWTFVWLMLILKIPIVALFLIVRWAVRQTPEEATGAGQDGGIGPRPRPGHPHHPRPRLPHTPRRGPHRSHAPAPPLRMRTAVAMKRLSCS